MRNVGPGQHVIPMFRVSTVPVFLLNIRPPSLKGNGKSLDMVTDVEWEILHEKALNRIVQR